MDDTGQKTATVFITKLEAARRQVDAAIRMTFLGEDNLAVHTVATAAYTILRDIKGKRGRSELLDAIHTGIFVSAKDYLAALSAGEPTDVQLLEGCESIIRDVAAEVAAGRITCPSEIGLMANAERRFWSDWVQPANFLKHADRDFRVLMPEGQFNNPTLILMASRSYAELLGHLTPEMEIFGKATFSVEPSLYQHGFEGRRGHRFRSLSIEARQKYCLQFLSKLKAKRQVSLPS